MNRKVELCTGSELKSIFSFKLFSTVASVHTVNLFPAPVQRVCCQVSKSVHIKHMRSIREGTGKGGQGVLGVGPGTDE